MRRQLSHDNFDHRRYRLCGKLGDRRHRFAFGLWALYKIACVSLYCLFRENTWRSHSFLKEAMRNIITAGVMVALSFQIVLIGEGAETSDKPNVLMICIDDLNDWVGFLGGHPDAITPHMDALAKRSRTFTNAHCNVPVCSASRASVMSGVAATTHGSYELGPKYEELPALSDVPTIQQYFKGQWLLQPCRGQGAAPRF